MDNLKFPEELGNGPVKRRWITDVFFAIFFFLFCCGMLFTSGYGFYFGNTEHLLVGWDADQNGCGYSDDTIDYPMLYWPQAPDTQLINDVKSGNYMSVLGLLNKGVCVKSCPSGDSSEPVECKPTTSMNADNRYKNCQYYPNRSSVSQGPAFRYKTINISGAFCIPKASDYVDKETYQAFKKAFFASAYGETAGVWAFNIMKAWQVLLVGAGVAAIFGYTYIFIIRLIGGAIIWISFVLLVLGLAGGGVYTWFFQRPKYELTDPTYTYLEYGSYALWGLAGLTLILLCLCYNAVKLGIAVFKTTIEYVQSNLQIFALPAIATIITTLWFCMWMGSAVYVFSVGYPSPRPGYEFVTKMKWTDKTRYIFFYHVFGLFWINAFIVGCTEFIIGASACIWYFECNTDSKGKGTVSRGYHWLLRYHLGSIAFGAFCIAVAQMIRFLFEYYRKKIQTMAPTKLVKAIICATRYCLWVMEKCVKYMTKNAYIQIALTNNNFCKSAWNAFTLMLKHAHRFGAGNSVGFIYNLFGVAVIAASTSGAGYMFMTNRNDLFDLSDPIPPTVALALISGTIGMLFLSIFSYSSDAILQSFLLDEELRFLGQDRPEAMQEFALAMKNRGKGRCEFDCF